MRASSAAIGRGASIVALTPSMQKIAAHDVVVDIQGSPAFPPFKVGGKQGNVVTKTTANYIHRGWRIVAVAGKTLAAADVAAALSTAAQQSGRYTVTFRMGEREEGEEEAGTAGLVSRKEARYPEAGEASRARQEAELAAEARRQISLGAAARRRQEEDEAERTRLEAEDAERKRLEVAEAERRLLEAEQAERERREVEEEQEAERKRMEAEEVERERLEAAEAERRGLEAEEVERQRQEAEEQERQRKEAEAAERQRSEAEEIERQRKEADEVELRRKAAEEAEERLRGEAERQRREAEEAERARIEAEEAAKRRQAEAEAVAKAEAGRRNREISEAERKRKEAERAERQRLDLEAARKAAAAAEAEKRRQDAEEAEKQRRDAEEAARRREREQEEERRRKEQDAAARRRAPAEAEEAARKREQEREREHTVELVIERKAAEKSLQKSTGLPPREQVAEPQKALMEALTGKARAAAPPRKAQGPCDKCDGPHDTDACPHFKKQRDKHKDAHDRYGKKGQAEAGDEKPVILKNARVLPQPGDGSCLFHSLSHGLRATNAAQLRAEIADFIAANPTVEVADNPIKDWVLWDSGMDTAAYAKSMRSGSRWGGAVELAVCAKVRRVRVDVYERCAGGFARISSFEGGGSGNERAVSLLYGGRVHYDALQV